MERKEIKIDGNSFCDLEGFYDEIDRVITKGLDWETGHNLDAFNDLLRGGFGVHDYEESIIIVWMNSDKSKRELGLPGTISHYEKLLANCEPSRRKYFETLLHNIENNNGETLYEILLDILKSHEHIELILK